MLLNDGLIFDIPFVALWLILWFNPLFIQIFDVFQFRTMKFIDQYEIEGLKPES